MNNRTRNYFAAIILTSIAVLRLPSAFAQGNDNPTGITGMFNGNSYTGCSYDPYTANAMRAIPEITVPGATGAYPLQWTRIMNSRATFGPFGSGGGWTHSYNWGAEAASSSTTRPSSYTVYHPDGRVITFTAGSEGITYYHGPLGVGERFQTAAGTGECYLIMTDGGKLHFHQVATLDNGVFDFTLSPVEIIDPHGLITSLTYDAQLHLTQVTEAAGRWLKITYASGRISQVQSGYGSGAGSYVTQIINYVYSTFTSGSFNYTVLTRADYNDGTSASYTYQNSNVSPYTGYPLISTCVDVRYPGPMKQIAYDFVQNGFYGQFSAEKLLTSSNPKTVTYNLSTHTETRGDGATRTFTYGTTYAGLGMPRPYLLGSVTDFRPAPNRATTYFGYDSNGYLNAVRDGRNNTTTFTRAINTGNILSLTHPGDGSSIVYTYTDQSTAYYLNSVRDELLHTTSYTRDANMNITRVDYPDGAFETFGAFNSLNQSTTHTNTSGGIETLAYDTRGMLTTYTPPATPSDPNPAAHPTRYDYNANDHLYHVTDPRGNVTTLFHNWIGQLTVEQHPGGSQRIWAYNDDGTLNTFTDENNQLTTFTYDSFKRLKTVTTPQRYTGDTTPRITSFFYGPNGTTGDDYGHTDASVGRVIPPSYDTNVLISYDENRRRTSVTNGWGTSAVATTTYTYDAVGNLLTVKEPNSQPGGINPGKDWDYAYDVRNRLTNIDDPTATNHNSNGVTLSIAYDAAGNETSELRANNQLITYNTYDAMNRLTKMTVTQTPEPSAVTNYTYWPNGLIHTMQDPGTNTYTYEYDVLNRLTKTTYPAGSTESNTYDIAGNLLTFKNRTGKTQTFTYDNRNRETAYSWDDPGTQWRTVGYDNASNVTSVNTNYTNINFLYYNDNLLKSQEEWTSLYSDNNHRTVTYQYDANANRSRITYSNIAFGYAYTGRQQVDNIYMAGAPTLPWVKYTYDPNGNRKTRQLYYGETTTYDNADELNRIKGLTHTFVGGPTARFDYGFDVVNRLKYERRDNGGGDGYTYDLADQGKDFIRNGTWNGTAIVGTPTQTYTYDANGNRTTMVTTSTTVNYATNALNQYYNITGVTPAPVPTYDTNGNLKTYNGSTNWTYSYDAMNRLTQATNGTTNALFYYDGLGRQIARNVSGVGITLSVWDGWDLIEEHVANEAPGTQPTTYLHGAAQDELVRRWYGGLTNVWYHQDGRRNTSHITGDGGAMIESYAYDLYGTPTFYDPSHATRPSSLYSVSHLFTGQRWIPQIGPSGMYDYRNRFMFPEIGRFLQHDPIGFAGGDNLYRYCGNDPANRSDPLGSVERHEFGTVKRKHRDIGGGAPAAPAAVGPLPGGGVLNIGGHPGSTGAGGGGTGDASGNNVAVLPGFDLGRTYYRGTLGLISLNISGSVTETIPLFSDGIQDATVDLANAVSALNLPRDAVALGSSLIAATLQRGTTSLFRAVNAAELADIAANNGMFRNLGSAEGKYFSTTAVGAASYARQTVGTALYEGPYTIVGTSISSNSISLSMMVTVDRGISTVLVPDSLLPSLSIARPFSFTPLPGF